MQISPFRKETVKISKFLKTKMAERKQQPTNEGEKEVLMYKITFTNSNARKKANINVKNSTV